jgi:hypothetical protein
MGTGCPEKQFAQDANPMRANDDEIADDLDVNSVTAGCIVQSRM